VTVEYIFEGNHTATAGYAQGTITLTADDRNILTGSYYQVFFTDSNGVLEGYDELASVPVTGRVVIVSVKEWTLLPPQATGLAVFVSRSRVPDDTPSIAEAVGYCCLPRHKQKVLTKPAYSFGVAADVHMNYELYGYGAYDKWAHALDVFAQERMDRVIVAGDVTGDDFEQPLPRQYEIYIHLIEASGYPVERVHEAIGNHGNTEDGRRLFTGYTSSKEEIRPFVGSPWFAVLDKGKTDDARDILFLFMAQELEVPWDSAACDNFSKEQVDWVEDMLKTYSNGHTHIIIVEHAPFLHYGPGDRPSGDYTSMITFKPAYVQTNRLKALLETYRDAVLLSGHTHLSLYDGENVSDEGGTSCRMVHVGSGCRPSTYNNEKGRLAIGDGRREVNDRYGSEAYTVAVYEDCMIFTGRNLSTDAVIPSASYILPVCADG